MYCSRTRPLALLLASVLVGLLVYLPAPARANTRSQILYAEGLIPFEAKNWEAAYRLFEQAVAADPSDALARYYQGLAAARLGLWNVALQDVESAIQLQPGIPRAAFDLGIIHFELGEYQAAEKWFDEASRQPCCRFTGLLFLGLTRYRLGDYPGALEFFQAAEQSPAVRPTALYYSALALLEQGEREKALSLLTNLKEESPDTEVGRVAAQYVAQARAERGPGVGGGPGLPRPWSLYVTGGFEYDSNVVLAPNDETIKVTRGISDESDGLFRIGLGGRYQVTRVEPISLRLGYDFSQSVHFELTEYDLQGHQLRAEISSPVGGVEVGAIAAYEFYALDYRSYLQRGIGSPWVTFFEGERAATRLYYSLRGSDYLRDPFEPYLDSINHAFGVRQTYAFSGANGILGATYQLDYEDPVSDDGAEFEYLGNQLEVGYTRPIRNWANASVAYLFRLEDYDSVNSRTGTELQPGGTRRRHDHQHQFALRLERPFASHWTAALFYVGVINGSNIEPFEYDRNVVGLNLAYRF